MNLALLLLVPALLAGGAALLLELVWIQRAGALLPGAAPAAALVVPAILVAWALGSWVAGRRADVPEQRLDRAARWLLVAAVGVWAAPWLLEIALPEGLVQAAWARALLGGLPAAPAAFALGGVVPWLTRLRAAQGQSALRAAAGSSAAVALGGAVAAWQMHAGLLKTGIDPLGTAATLLGLAGLVLLLLRALLGAAPDVPTVAEASTSAVPAPAEDARPWWLVSVVGGAVLVGGQVLFLRVLAQSQGDSLSTTAALLAALHLGMALGAVLLAALGSRLAAGLRGVGLLAIGGMALVFPSLGLGAVAHAEFWLGVPLGIGCGCLAVAAADLQPRGASRLGSWVGDLGAASTFGGVLGGVGVGIFVLGTAGVGTSHGLQLLSGALAVCALLLAVWTRGFVSRVSRAVPVAAAALLLAWAPAWEAPWRVSLQDRELLMQSEGPHGIVSLVRTADGSERLQIDGRFGLGGGGRGAVVEQRMGRLAAAMQPAAQRALMLGIGRGHTLAGLAATTHAQVDAVEHNAEVLALQLGVPALFGGNGRQPTPRILHADARAWLAEQDKTYDLIVGDLFYPWASGAGSLLSVEHFLEVRRALTEEGMYVQWLPLHQLPWPAFAAVARAFRQAFPSTHVMIASSLNDTPLAALVGNKGQALPELEQVNALLAESACLAGPNHMSEVFDALLCSAWELERELGDGPTNTLEQPWSEWLSQSRHTDETKLAGQNFRQLALLAAPLAWSSFREPPIETTERKALGLELQARSAALGALLHARADLAQLREAGQRGVSSEWRSDRERQLTLRLLSAWRVFPGHLDLRRVLLEYAQELWSEQRPTDAAAILGEALRVHADGALGAALGAALLDLERHADALSVLRQARELAPDDASLLLHLARAEFAAGTPAAARGHLMRAVSVLSPQALPAPAAAALGLLDGHPNARAEAHSVVDALPAQHAWARLLLRLLDETQSGTN